MLTCDPSASLRVALRARPSRSLAAPKVELPGDGELFGVIALAQASSGLLFSMLITGVLTTLPTRSCTVLGVHAPKSAGDAFLTECPALHRRTLPVVVTGRQDQRVITYK